MTKSDLLVTKIGLRVAVSLALGVVGGILVGIFISWKFAPLSIWDFAAIIFLVWSWNSLHRLDALETKKHATREDPGRAEADIILLIASVASLAGVGVLLVQAGQSNGVAKIAQIGIGIASVVISWAMVHTIYALKYAREYYSKTGIDFHSGDQPCFLDFAYLSFTIGMTFQVSDTDIKTTPVRRMILQQALLSYLFGTVIVAITINLIAGLGK